MLVTARNPGGDPLPALIDGNPIRLRAALPRPARLNTVVVFRLEGTRAPLGTCTILLRSLHCDTDTLDTLGWYWGAAATAPGLRRISASADSGALAAAVELRIAPRPVVLVHGFMSDSKTWSAYRAADGFLAPHGLKGYAVGDGQAEGVMNTGDIARPTRSTHTLAENAGELARYIDGVKKATGAQMVDLVAHSMGGLVSRYYVGRLMPQRDVAQLLMLGPPNGGSDCSGLASALGFLGPASLELRPAYLRQIFNRGVTRRHGVPFHTLAGNAIVEAFKAPCSSVPSDVVVGIDSASAIPGEVVQLPVLHTDMTNSQEVFRRFVLPRLQHRPGDWYSVDEAMALPETEVTAQFTQVFTGRVEAGGTTEVEVHLDRVTIASFALFDPTRSLDVTVRGASGNLLRLSAPAHGLIKVDDPASLVYLGYGFSNPQPGPWRVTLRASPRTAADFALSARVLGGARLQARASPLSAALREAVTLTAALDFAGGSLADVNIRAVIQPPTGRPENVVLQGSGSEMSAVWRPAQRGLHGIDIIATGRSEGLRIERTSFLAVEVGGP